MTWQWKNYVYFHCPFNYSHYTTMGGYFSRWWFGTEEDYTPIKDVHVHDEVGIPHESHLQKDLNELHLQGSASQRSHIQFHVQSEKLQGAWIQRVTVASY